MSLSNLPPGCSGAPKPAEPVRFYCANENCEGFEEKWEAPATTELGAVALVNEEQVGCPECGQEGVEEL